MLPEEEAGDDGPLRSKSNPFLDVPHDKNASVVKQGFLQRKLHADIDGKRSEWDRKAQMAHLHQFGLVPLDSSCYLISNLVKLALNQLQL